MTHSPVAWAACAVVPSGTAVPGFSGLLTDQIQQLPSEMSSKQKQPVPKTSLIHEHF